jgi:opacity protein-like surface antigen
MKRIFAVAAVLAMLVPPAALAQPVQASRSGGTYVFGRLGAVIPQHDDLEGFDNGLAFEAGLGSRINPNLAIEGSIGHFAMKARETLFDPTLGPVAVSADFSAIPVVGTAKFIAPTGNLDLYALLGAGLYFTQLNGSGSVTGLSVDVSDSDTSVGIHLGGGLSVNLAPNVNAGAELRYVIGSAELFDEKGRFDSLLLTGHVGFRF